MLFDPSRHEPLQERAWDEAAARAAIERIVRDAEARFSPQAYWPLSPRDAGGDDTAPMYDLYFGACGVIWALDYLRAVGAVALERAYADCVEPLRALNQASLEKARLGSGPSASYLCGDTGVLMLEQALRPAATTTARLEALIAGNLDHPSRELMWGAPGTTLAALFLHRSTGEARWADWFRAGARALWSQLERFPQHGCSLWVQDLYGHRVEYLGAVHGFISGVLPIVKGRDLLSPREWAGWNKCIAETVIATAMRKDGLANWRPTLDVPPGWTDKRLMQLCHGAPGFVIGLGDFPGGELDEVLLGAGEAIWAAGPLAKGSNLCHGTGGNGYAFLKLFARTGDERWLARARAFAMYGIDQTERDAQRYGAMRYSLWTGDVGFAIYLWDCLRGEGRYPTLDVFFPEPA
jgi:hypothetical protein